MLTPDEFLSLFNRPGSDARWIGSADSEEWTVLVTYLVNRNTRESLLA